MKFSLKKERFQFIFSLAIGKFHFLGGISLGKMKLLRKRHFFNSYFFIIDCRRQYEMVGDDLLMAVAGGGQQIS